MGPRGKLTTFYDRKAVREQPNRMRAGGAIPSLAGAYRTGKLGFDEDLKNHFPKE